MQNQTMYLHSWLLNYVQETITTASDAGNVPIAHLAIDVGDVEIVEHACFAQNYPMRSTAS